MSILESIIQFEVSKESDAQAYNSLGQTVASHSIIDRYILNSFCRVGETDFMEKFHHNTDGARKKDGSWKFRTYLPAAYSSAKSVLGSALDAGIPILDSEGKVKGKSALQKSIKTHKDTTTEEKSNVDKAQIMLRSVIKIIKKCNSTELAEIDAMVADVAEALELGYDL